MVRDSLGGAVKELEGKIVSIEKDFAVHKNNIRWMLAIIVVLTMLMASPDSFLFKFIHMISELKKATP